MDPRDLDAQVRVQAFRFLEEQTLRHAETLPREVLAAGFYFRGTRVPLLGPQGIFKPAILPEIPLSITTVPIVEGKKRPYEDEIGEGGLIRYRYRGTDPTHRENAGLRLAMQRQAPLVYFFGLVPGRYAAAWPVYIVADDPGALCFTVADDEKMGLPSTGTAPAEVVAEGRRLYVTTLTLKRLHQQSFRHRVLQAYRECCAICRLRHEELLEAAHILPDGHPKGMPWVSNGIALCKLHHAAYDRNILGITPKLMVEIREDVLRERDGPMLVCGLQECHKKPLQMLPTADHLKPRRDFLEERYEMFRKVV